MNKGQSLLKIVWEVYKNVTRAPKQYYFSVPCRVEADAANLGKVEGCLLHLPHYFVC